jgi:hypothetical protein
MVNSIVSTELREQAGSNSYNRFEYQVHWIVYHMITEYKKNSQFYIFCEFHDDMAKTELSSTPSCAEFFQIKTTERFKEWTFKNLFRTYKKPKGGFKNSFLGFLFYNFLKFNDECSKCHFVSNIGMDEKVRTWQSVIEDGKDLKCVDLELYSEIKDLMKKEYEDLDEITFNSVFDKFVQNTFLYDGDLHIHNYEKAVAGTFFTMLENEDIYTSNSNKILKDIIEDVRKKSKRKIQTPISYNSLKEKKGVSSEIFSRIKDQVKNIEQSEEKYKEIENFLNDYGFKTTKLKLLIRVLKKHKRMMLNTSNSLYIDSVDAVIEIIDDILIKNYNNIDNQDFLMTTALSEVIQESSFIISKNIGIDIILVEALYYERINE